MLVIGNGESRRSVDLDLFTCVKIGCNALYRDYRVRHLVCVDRKMVREALDANYNNDSLIYTRKCWLDEFSNIKNMRPLPELPYAGSERYDEPINWNSGPYAILQALTLSNRGKVFVKDINIIGFDLYGTSDNKVNNIYKDTNNYSLSRKSAVDPRYWIIQIAKLAEEFPQNNFIFYTTPNWKKPSSWKCKNIVIDKLENLSYN